MSRRILLVDDDVLTLDVLRTILDLEEFQVTTAADGESALAAVTASRPDAIVLDVMMPGIDGFEVCEKLKGDPATSEIPIVLLTAKDRPEDRERGEQAGANAYLTKPFSPLSLIETLNKLAGDA